MLVSDIVAEDLPDWAREDAGLYCSCIGGAASEREYLEGLRRAGLRDVEVRGRLIYDEMQLRALVESESCGSGGDAGCCSSSQETTDRMAKALAGKVKSAIFYARK